MYNKIVIGLDQSYTRTGIGIAIDGVLVKVTSTSFKGCRIKSDKRKELRNILHRLLTKATAEAQEVIILTERIRTFSHNNGGGEDGDGQGTSGKVTKGGKGGMFISTDYIKATGALIATIVDIAYEYQVPVYSVDTRSWKSKIVGTTKGKHDGKGKDKKSPTIDFIMAKGFDVSSKNRNGVVVYDDDACDAGCIALYGFVDHSKQSLKKEE